MGGNKPTEAIRKIALLLAVASLTACFTIAAPPDGENGPDRETDDETDDTKEEDDDEDDDEPPPSSTIIDTQLSHSDNPVPVAGVGIYCPKDGTEENAEQSYFRVFDLDDSLFDVGADIKIENVEFGVEYAVDDEDDDQQIKVVLHTMAGTVEGTEDNLSLAGMTEIASVDVTISNQTLIGMHTTSIAATVTRDKTLVAEIRVPRSGGNNEDRLFKLGSNPLGQTAESYFLAPECEVNQPTKTGLLTAQNPNFPAMHFIIMVNGKTLGRR